MTESNNLAAAQPERLAAMKAALAPLHKEIAAEGPQWSQPKRGRQKAGKGVK